MKHLSLQLTVLLLGAIPLAASALDYGPERALLAANTGVAPAAVMPPRATVADVESGAGSDDTVDAATATPRVAPSSRTQPAVESPANRSAPIRDQARGAEPPPRVHDAHPPSWRSLLPGSIQ